MQGTTPGGGKELRPADARFREPHILVGHTALQPQREGKTGRQVEAGTLTDGLPVQIGIADLVRVGIVIRQNAVAELRAEGAGIEGEKPAAHHDALGPAEVQVPGAFRSQGFFDDHAAGARECGMVLGEE